MTLLLKKIKHDALTIITMLFGAARKVDYKALNTYILNINQTNNSLQGILEETSICLKDILQYRLFAFVIQEEGKLDAWIDPNINMNYLEKAIQNDFNTRQAINVHFIHQKERAQTGQDSGVFVESDLASYEIINGAYRARIYLIPQRRILEYHREIITTILKTVRISVSNYMSIKKLETEAAIDPLTNCVNRREFTRLMKGCMANARRYGKDLSLLMFDIDYFKQVNDTYGHHAGDLVLKEIAAAIGGEIRSGDILARYGGEEFIVILPETKKQKAIELAERLRRIVEKRVIMLGNKAITVTASFGISTLNGHLDISSMVNDADAMLYKAKQNGRNAVMPGIIRLYSKESSDQVTLSGC